MKSYLLVLAFILSALNLSAAAPWDHGPLRVSADGRQLQHANGAPFFWLGDTAWLMPQRLNRAEVKDYFENRRAKGFNVIQCCLVQSFNDKSFNGSLALVAADLTKLNVTPGNDPADPAQYDYWDHVDYIVETAKANGIYLALTPMWRYSNNARAGGGRRLCHPTRRPLRPAPQHRLGQRWLRPRQRDAGILARRRHRPEKARAGPAHHLPSLRSHPILHLVP